MITLDLDPSDRTQAVISTSDRSHDLGAWARLCESLQRGFRGGSDCKIHVALNVVLAELAILREISRRFNADVRIGEGLKSRVTRIGRDRAAREAVVRDDPPTGESLVDQLKGVGFKRKLRKFQERNLAKLIALPHGADFSVPGAGKTTVALANYALQRNCGRVAQAIVVAPISAFESWKTEIGECFHTAPRLAVHTTGESIPVDTEILLTNYHRLAADAHRVRSWVVRRPTHVILDEAHRMKRGRDGVHGRATLDLSFDAERRDVLSGTPTPQGANDLVALIEYLYPGQAKQILPAAAFVPKLSLEDDVLRDANRAIRRYFVRTRKSDLDLPPTEMTIVPHAMGPIQRSIYEALVGTYRGRLQLTLKDRRDLKRLGEVVMYLLEASTNPLLLPAGSDQNDLAPFAHPPLDLSGCESLKDLVANYGRYERPWKYDCIAELVAANADQNQKTLVWTNFVRNIRLLSIELARFRPAIVHGGIPTGNSSSPPEAGTREYELDRFRYDPDCWVLLANPAAAGEGISLHHWCHTAVYLDRTFNAGHLLQSQDRIHRLGLDEHVSTRFVFLVSEETIDEQVNNRLRAKVQALAILLDDPELVRIALPDTEDVDDANEPASMDDLLAVRQHLEIG